MFCYVNSVFAPGLDEGVGGLWRVSCDDSLRSRVLMRGGKDALLCSACHVDRCDGRLRIVLGGCCDYVEKGAFADWPVVLQDRRSTDSRILYDTGVRLVGSEMKLDHDRHRRLGRARLRLLLGGPAMHSRFS